jgi:ATP-dependent DNA helicase RecQ
MTSLGIDVKGKIAAADSAEPGRSVARFTDLALGARVRECVRGDGAVPADLIAASVKVLAAWDWQSRPVAIAAIGSSSRPALVVDLARQLAGIGRLTDLGVVARRGRGGGERSNSAHRLRTVWDSYVLPDAMAASLGGGLQAAPVLLVDDFADSGWTIAVVARLLRQAGAGAVYPFVLGQAS